MESGGAAVIERSDEWEQLADAAMARMMSWDITKREKLVAGWIVELTYKRRRHSVCVPRQGLFCLLTGLDERGVSTALDGLKRSGVLQVSGPRNGAKWYTLLPNGRMLEPDTVAKESDVLAAVAEIEQFNGTLLPGTDPGGQRRLAIVTTEEQLAEEQAAASRALAVDGRARFLRADDLSEKERSGGLIFPKRKEESWPEVVAAPTGTNARERTLNVNTPGTTNVERSNVGCGRNEGAEMADAIFAFNEVRDLMQRAGLEKDFEQWEMKWRQRCGLRPSRDPELKAQPRLIAMATSEVRGELLTGKKVPNPGGSIVDRVKRALGEAARTFRMFIA